MFFWYNIHGLALEISAADPIFNEIVFDELRPFRLKTKSADPYVLRVLLDTFDEENPPTEMGSDRFQRSGDSTFHYGKSLISVASNHRKRHILVRLARNSSIFPDPAYYFCVTQPLRLWFKEKGLFFLHASCVSANNEGVLIIGPSRAGKSALALSAVRKGFRFLSDEQPLLSLKSGRVFAHAFPRRVRLNRSVAAIFPELRRLTSSFLTERLVFPIEKIWPDSIDLSPCAPRLLIFPKYRPRGKLKLTRLHPSNALANLLDDDNFIWYKGKPWDKISRAHLTCFERLMAQATAFTLDYQNKDILDIPLIFQKLLRGSPHTFPKRLPR